MKGFKGFNPDFTCNGKQYEENTVFEEDKAEICNSGMHFCEYPLDVFGFYPPINDNCELNEFAEVEALDEVNTDDKIKYCTKKLKVGAKIGIPGLVQASVDYIVEKAEKEKISTNTGDFSASTNTGNRSASIVEGKDSVAIAFGVDSKAKGALGCYIALAEWKHTNNGFVLKDFQSVKVDDEKIKADTFYKLQNGEFVEAENEVLKR